MTPLPDLLQTIAVHRCCMMLEGETVKLCGPTPLPDTILAELRARKSEVVEFLSRQHTSQVPAEWMDGVVRVGDMSPVADWPSAARARLQAALPEFLTAWAPQAFALGWGTLDLFGCHPGAPYSRLDQQGLALGLSELEVVAMSEQTAAVTLCQSGSNRMTYYRRPVEVMKGAVPIWQIGARI